MKLLNIKPNAVNRVFASLSGHSKATENAILTACKYAIYFSLKDNNRERANQILPVVSKRYESIVKRYILTYASLEWDNETKEFVTLDGFVQPVGAEAIEEHKQKTLEFVSQLPDFDSLPKQPKTTKPLERGAAEKAIKATLLRLTRLLKDQDMNNAMILNEAKIIHSFESYMNKILDGVAVEEFVDNIELEVINNGYVWRGDDIPRGVTFAEAKAEAEAEAEAKAEDPAAPRVFRKEQSA